MIANLAHEPDHEGFFPYGSNPSGEKHDAMSLNRSVALRLFVTYSIVVPYNAALSLQALLDGGHFNPGTGLYGRFDGEL